MAVPRQGSQNYCLLTQKKTQTCGVGHTSFMVIDVLLTSSWIAIPIDSSNLMVNADLLSHTNIFALKERKMW
ncbi:hypothetical protein PanWU01x14_340090 [Parasponia andersonii]|uniref:Uncharacterized protein n=1 Tax=Parasponia andersonii TaxID=3476 RepID=A0A2P5AEI7_PARAD|nr:hypothetical protein PanWU01x14_340090 [Parasponia andersonii]